MHSKLFELPQEVLNPLTSHAELFSKISIGFLWVRRNYWIIEANIWKTQVRYVEWGFSLLYNRYISSVLCHYSCCQRWRCGRGFVGLRGWGCRSGCRSCRTHGGSSCCGSGGGSSGGCGGSGCCGGCCCSWLKWCNHQCLNRMIWSHSSIGVVKCEVLWLSVEDTVYKPNETLKKKCSL